MAKRILLLFILSSVLLITLFSQDEEILLTIDGHKISLDEFLRMYNKNNSQGITEKQKIDEYLNLFIHFKLKVIEAENLKLDTSAVFQNELDGYVRQLAKPYLSDPNSYDQLLLEAYNRMNKEIHASHILIGLDEKASPEDTLAAYHRIIEIKNQGLKGEDFTALAEKYSEDRSVTENKGDLGWFGAFKMVYYPLESAAYNTPPGQISIPVRSYFGYHIIKVHEVRPAKPRLHAAHIFVRAPESMTSQESETAKNKIFSLYDQLQQGMAFEKLAMTESEDKSTGVNGGELPWFCSGEMIPAFEDAAYSLHKPGQFSPPVRSFYGWHIIKLLDRKELKSFEEEKPGIIQMFSSADRLQQKQLAYISKLKKDYHYAFFRDNFSKMYELVDTSIFRGKWQNNQALTDKDVIFTIGNEKVMISDFADYLYQNQRSIEPYNLRIFIDDQYKAFCESRILDYETALLPGRYPEFAHIVREYHDGILLFDLTDKNVWSKAVLDTLGLEQFYQRNKNKYTWGERAEAFIITSKKKEITDKAMALAGKNGRKKKFTADFLLKKICPEDSSRNCLSMLSGKYEKGEHEEVDLTEWKEGTTRYFEKNNETGFVFIKNRLGPEIKQLDEARGLIIADYQAFLENEWLKSLKLKYRVEVNNALLKKLKQSDG